MKLLFLFIPLYVVGYSPPEMFSVCEGKTPEYMHKIKSDWPQQCLADALLLSHNYGPELLCSHNSSFHAGMCTVCHHVPERLNWTRWNKLYLSELALIYLKLYILKSSAKNWTHNLRPTSPFQNHMRGAISRANRVINVHVQSVLLAF